MLFEKVGIGTDIEDISRFRQLDYGTSERFFQKVFTRQEIDYCLNKKNPAQHFAVRFCAKEAFIKATGRHISNYRDIEVIMEDKKPVVVWNSKKHLVSLSHDKDKAVAFVVVEHET